MILEFGDHTERFEGDKWTAAGIQAVTIAYAANAPDDVLSALAGDQGFDAASARRVHQRR